MVFNFPDRGVGTVGTLAVQANQDMLAAFFKPVKALLAKDGEVHVAVAASRAQAAWNVAGIAARGGLTYRAALDFKPEEFPGYQHFRTLPHASLLRRRQVEEEQEVDGADDDEEDEDEDEDEDEEGEGELVEAAEEDVAVGAKTLIFQVDHEAKGAGGHRGGKAGRGKGGEGAGGGAGGGRGGGAGGGRGKRDE